MDHRKMSTVNCRSAMKNGTDLLLLDDRGLGTCENRHYGYIRSDNLIIRRTPTPVSCWVKNTCLWSIYTVIAVHANKITRCLDTVACNWISFGA